ncbi:hypothetical protein [Bacillus wiedmannii]|uniref:hypothetical protein n=1 Tax=Bacillus wiedmannii TaxID=1890302 RepID=UPI000BF82AE5|nr:hypothetical protein [Bacillus wiedmannii]PFY96968.1 hypothetical protein COL57_15835 [Bacillus wiedmannii]
MSNTIVFTPDEQQAFDSLESIIMLYENALGLTPDNDDLKEEVKPIVKEIMEDKEKFPAVHHAMENIEENKKYLTDSLIMYLTEKYKKLSPTEKVIVNIANTIVQTIILNWLF